jgi:leader peptidase (prepilin peptidase)/N-methyltransferase
VLVAGCALLGLLIGWLVPGLIGRLPERQPDAGDAELGTVGPGERPAPAVPYAAGPATGASPLRREPTYAEIARWPLLRPVLAALTAAVFGMLAAARGATADLPAFLALGATGVVLGTVDVRRHRLPDVVTGPALVVGALLLAGAAALGGADGTWSAYGRAWAGAFTLGAVYAALHLLRPADLGFGDVKLAVLLGLHLGWLGWGVLVAGGFLGFVVGGLVGVGLLLTRRATLRSAVPFGPSMLVGALLAVLWGQPLVDAYLGR